MAERGRVLHARETSSVKMTTGVLAAEGRVDFFDVRAHRVVV